jgi:hypothetical protein
VLPWRPKSRKGRTTREENEINVQENWKQETRERMNLFIDTSRLFVTNMADWIFQSSYNNISIPQVLPEPSTPSRIYVP